jgi:hypothetical protein
MLGYCKGAWYLFSNLSKGFYRDVADSMLGSLLVLPYSSPGASNDDGNHMALLSISPTFSGIKMSEQAGIFGERKMYCRGAYPGQGPST